MGEGEAEREGAQGVQLLSFPLSFLFHSLIDDASCGPRNPKKPGKNRNNKQDACIKAGLIISGINAEVMPGQWEFQIGPVGPLEVGDQVIFSPAFPFFPCLFFNLSEDGKKSHFLSLFLSTPKPLLPPSLSTPKPLPPPPPPKKQKNEKTEKRS